MLLTIKLIIFLHKVKYLNCLTSIFNVVLYGNDLIKRFMIKIIYLEIKLLFSHKTFKN